MIKRNKFLKKLIKLDHKGTIEIFVQIEEGEKIENYLFKTFAIK